MQEGSALFAGKPHAYIGQDVSGQASRQKLVRSHPDVIDLKPAVVGILGCT